MNKNKIYSQWFFLGINTLFAVILVGLIYQRHGIEMATSLAVLCLVAFVGMVSKIKGNSNNGN